jgi:sialate O-acetylesterase
MKKNLLNTRILLLASLILHQGLLQAELSIFPLFQNNTVFQRDIKVPVWGKADPGDEITVTFADQTKTTKTSDDGKWRIDLDPMPANATAQILNISSGNPKSAIQNLKFENVLVGDVWLCSGQSNMEMGVAASQGGKEAVSAANFPLIRQFKVQKNGAQEPVDTVSGKWTLCSPSTAGAFTATGFYFAREIHEKTGVPIGLLNNAVSGAQIEPWFSKTTLETNPKLAPALERYTTALAKFPEASAKYKEDMAAWEKERDEAKAAGTAFSKKKPNPPMGPGHDNFPVAFYNGMVHPLIPYAIRGTLWYQGESNTGRVDEYRDVFPIMITQWREEWGQGDFPFYFVQLPVYGDYPASWSGFREAQAQALKLPNIGMAVTIDISDTNDLHPKNKLDVGLRLAAIAKAKTYNIPDTEFSGPLYVKAEKEGSSWRVTFNHSAGMAPRGEKLIGFELAGEDKAFVAADAVIENNGSVLVSSPKVPDPAFIRYGWAVAGANLYNAADLPAVPFRTDVPEPK